jgi:penicillin-binding protein 1A
MSAGCAQTIVRSAPFGPYPRSVADVVKPGDIVMAEPTKAKMPDTFTLCQVPEISSALVAIDPHTGRVLAISGGFSFETSQFDRATQAKRQPGSSIKPFVYLTALDHGLTPSTLVVDGPISLPQGPGLPMWTPENYANEQHGPKYRGPTPLRVGLEQSLNAMTARLASIVGMEPIAQTIERFGIMDHTPREYSMALGSGETTPSDGRVGDAREWRQAHQPDFDRSHPRPRRYDDLPS